MTEYPTGTVTDRLPDPSPGADDALPPVRVTFEVAVGQEAAFHAFTANFDRWWPRIVHVGSADLAQAVLEPAAGGRWYERGTDGSECDWGHVLEWNPSHRLALAWGLDANYVYRPGAENASRVNVTFTALGPDRTQVDLEHSDFVRHLDGAAGVRAAVSHEGGWPGILHAYAAFIAAG
jgi:uncharacterized protein YndB with AHSA1/START domain